MFKNYMWSHVLMEEPADQGGDSGSSDVDITKIDWKKFDWSKFDVNAIPEDVIKKTSIFNTVKDEAATRRKENTQLKKQVEAILPKDDEPVVQEKPEPKPDDMPEWAKKLQASLDTMTSERVNTWRKEAADTYGLKGKAVERLQGTTRDEFFADAKTLSEELGIPKPDAKLNSSIGNVSQTRDKARIEAVKARMRGGRNATNIFSPEAQAAMGGGIIIDE